jgi:hypothetical protein
VGFGRKAIVAYLYEPSCAFRLWLLLDYLCVETTLRWGVQGLVGVTLLRRTSGQRISSPAQKVTERPCFVMVDGNPVPNTAPYWLSYSNSFCRIS